MGGFIAGLFIIACLAVLNKRWHWIYEHPKFLGLILTPINITMLYWLTAYDTSIVHYHYMAACCGLIALSLGWTMSAPCEIPTSRIEKIFLSIVVIAGPMGL